jgi:putative transposase
VNLRDRASDLLVREIDLLRAKARATKARHPFHIDAWVVLPEHMHCLCTLHAARRRCRFCFALAGNQVCICQAPAA